MLPLGHPPVDRLIGYYSRFGLHIRAAVGSRHLETFQSMAGLPPVGFVDRDGHAALPDRLLAEGQHLPHGVRAAVQVDVERRRLRPRLAAAADLPPLAQPLLSQLDVVAARPESRTADLALDPPLLNLP